MALGSEFQLAIECKMKLRLRNHRFHWILGIGLQILMPTPLMSHHQRHHFWPRLDNRALLSETHCNFCNGGSKEIKWTMRAYENLDHLPIPRYTFLNLEILIPLICLGLRTQNQL